MTMNPLHHCPACGREFKDILDYPRVRILEFERLPIPEAIDSMSGAAAEKRLARWRAERSEPDALPSLRDEGNFMASWETAVALAGFGECTAMGDEAKSLPAKGKMHLGCQRGPTSPEMLDFFNRHGVEAICG